MCSSGKYKKYRLESVILQFQNTIASQGERSAAVGDKDLTFIDTSGQAASHGTGKNLFQVLQPEL